MRAPTAWIEGLDARTGLPDAVRIALEARLAPIPGLLRRAASGNPESPQAPRRIHRLRVGIRRAVAAIDAFSEVLGRKPVRRMKRRLRRLRRAAGRVRDLDVTIERLGQAAAHLKRSEAAAARRLATLAAEARADAATRFHRVAAATSPEKLERGRERILDSIDAGAVTERDLAAFGRREIRRHAELLRAAGTADLSVIDNAHELRIVVKRLRYALEVFAACFPVPQRRALFRELVALQERLGLVNDLAIMCERLDAEARARPADRGLASLARRFRTRFVQEHRAFVEAWTRGDPELPGARGFVDRLEAAVRPPVPEWPLAAIEPKLPSDRPETHDDSGVHTNGAARRSPSARRFAAIDVGTNSLRLIVAEASPDGSYRILDDEKEVTRLGRGLHATGRLDPAAIEHSAVAVEHMKAIAEGYGAKHIRVVATAAARAASNGGDLCRAVEQRTGLPMEIISAEQEALLAYRSAARAFDLRGLIAAVVDIGGGSTEVVLSVGRDVQRAGAAADPEPRRVEAAAPSISSMVERVFTIPLGAVGLTERFAQGGAPDRGKAFRRMRKFARKVVSEHMSRPPQTPQLVIGTGGTLTTLGAMALHRDLGTPDATLFAGVVQGYEVPRSEIRHLLEYVRKLPPKDRTSVPGLSADRADIIVAGLVIIDAVLRQLGVNRVRVHEGGIRDGMLLSMMESAGSGPVRGEADHADPLASVRRLARACAYEEAHSLHVAALAVSIFDQLEAQVVAAVGDATFKRVRLRQMLEAAAILHDIGYLINYTAHHKHSYHLIVHADLPGWTSREVQIIACVARYHRCAAPKARHRAFSVLPEADQRVVRALAGILRIADGLDRTHVQRVRGVRIQVADHQARFDVHADEEPSVDLWGAARKSRLFERALGLTPHLEWRVPAVARRRVTSADQAAVQAA